MYVCITNLIWLCLPVAEELVALVVGAMAMPHPDLVVSQIF